MVERAGLLWAWCGDVPPGTGLIQPAKMGSLAEPVVLKTDRLRWCLPCPVSVWLPPRVSVVDVELGPPLARRTGPTLGSLALLLALLGCLERGHVLLKCRQCLLQGQCCHLVEQGTGPRGHLGGVVDLFRVVHRLLELGLDVKGGHRVPHRWRHGSHGCSAAAVRERRVLLADEFPYPFARFRWGSGHHDSLHLGEVCLRFWPIDLQNGLLAVTVDGLRCILFQNQVLYSGTKEGEKEVVSETRALVTLRRIIDIYTA